MGPAPVVPRGEDGRTTRNSATVSAWTLVSRVTGLLRVVVVGLVLGPTFLANAFLATNVVPSIVFSVVAGPVIGMVVVPALVGGSDDARLVLRRAAGVLAGAAAVAAVVVGLASPVLAWTLTVGVPHAVQDRALLVTVMLLFTVAPQIVLYTVAALAAAAQQARGRFAVAAAAPAAENLGLILTMTAVYLSGHGGREIGEVGLGTVALLGAGATVSVLLHAGIQVAGARRAGWSLLPARGWRADPRTRELLGRLRRAVPVAAYPSAGFYVVLGVAATVPGGVLSVQIAHAVYAVAAALGARAIATAVQPTLAAAVARRDEPAFAASWRSALDLTVLAALPPLCLMVVLAAPAADLLSGGTAALAACIAVLGVAQLAAGVHEVGRQALFARLDVRGPLVAGLRGCVCTVAGAALAAVAASGPARLVALAAALLAADVVSGATVWSRLRRAIRPEALVDRIGVLGAVGSATTMVPVLLAALMITEPGGTGAADLLVLMPFTGLALALYAGCVFALRRRRGRAAPAAQVVPS